MAKTISPNVRAMPTWDTAPALISLMTMAPVPANTRQNVPRNSAPSLRIRGLAKTSRLSFLAELEPATAEIYHIFVLEHIWMERVGHKLALLVIAHQSRMAQYAEVMRDVGDVFIQQLGERADMLRRVPQALNNPQPLRVGERFEKPRASVGLKFVLHEQSLARPLV